jgi:hypothetical protein
MSLSGGEVEVEESGLKATVKCNETGGGNFPLSGGREITQMTLSSCKLVTAGSCEGTPTMEAVHLPWSAGVENLFGTKEEKLWGKGEAPGFLVKCKRLLGTVESTCTTSPEWDVVTNQPEYARATYSEPLTCHSAAFGEKSGHRKGKEDVTFSYGGAASSVDSAEVEQLHALKWRKNEVPLSEAATVKGKGKITVRDPSAGGAKIECETATEGKVGPGYGGEVQSWKTSNCKVLEAGQCTKGLSLEPRKLPWKSELVKLTYNHNVMIEGEGGGSPTIVLRCTVSAGLEFNIGNSGGIYTTTSNVSSGVGEQLSSTEKLESAPWGNELLPGMGTLEGSETLELKNGGKLEAS